MTINTGMKLQDNKIQNLSSNFSLFKEEIGLSIGIQFFCGSYAYELCAKITIVANSDLVQSWAFIFLFAMFFQKDLARA